MNLFESVRSLTILVVGLTITAISAFLCGLVLLPMVPWRYGRIVACNYYGKFLGPTLMKLSGAPIEIIGREHLDPDRPAIYISNHTSISDIFMAIWLSPIGTVGVAKKEVIYYPFFGQLYWLSGHLRIDRGNTRKALKSLHELRDIVNANGLSIYLWPEGTRSRDGRLLPFRKGVVHLAKQTGLPIVPIVISGAHRLWEKSTLKVRKTPITIRILPPVPTEDWNVREMRNHLERLHEMYVEHLPDEQKPAEIAQAAAK